MSANRLGLTSILLMGRAANNKVNVTGVATGTESVSFSETQDTREIPGGRGVTATQLGSHSGITSSVASDSNPVHDPVFRDANGRRRFFTFLPTGSGAGKPSVIGEMVTVASLTMDLDSGACTWAWDFTVDGKPTRAAQNPAINVPAQTTPTESYKTGECDFYFGGSDFLIPLREDISGAVALTGSAIVLQRRRLVADATHAYMTADGLSCSFAVSIPVFDSALQDKLYGDDRKRQGFFVIRRKDAEWVYAMPAVLPTLAEEYPSADAITKTLDFSQAPGGNMVMGAPRAAGNVPVAAGQELYIVDIAGNRITRNTANAAVPANGFGVVGVPHRAEAAA